MRIIFLSLLLLFSFCKKNKQKEIFDPEWREKYLEISFNTCKKLESCFKDSESKLNPKLKNLVKSEYKPENCSEKSKKSKIYLLKVKNPDEAKLAATECFVALEKMSCDDLKKNKLDEVSACKITRLLQSD